MVLIRKDGVQRLVNRLLRPTRSSARQKNLGLRILVVADNPNTAASFSLLLQSFGHQVRFALNRTAALRAVQAFSPDVVLFDLDSVDRDDLEVARLVQQRVASKPPFLIAVSAAGISTMVSSLEGGGFDLHLPRPLDFEFLRVFLQRFQRVILSQ